MKNEPLGPKETGLVHRLLVALVTGACRYPRAVLAASLVLCLVCGFLAYTRLQFRTQRTDLVHPHKDYLQRWRQYVAEFGEDDDIVVVVKGANRQRMGEAIEALAHEIEQHPQLYDRLFYKVDLRNLHNRALLYLSTDQIKQIRGSLQDMHLLLEFGPLSWREFTLFRLLREARCRLGRLQPDEPLSTPDQQFFTQLLAVSRSVTATLAEPRDYRSPWTSLLPQSAEQKDLLAEPQYFFSEDGTLAFLLVRPVKDPQSFVECQTGVETLRGILAKGSSRFADLELGLTGLPVLETDEIAASQRDTSLASWLALAGVAILYLFFFRSFRYPLLTVTTLLVGTIWALGWLTLTVGHLNILSATFAVMLIGMGDYGVLWVTRYEQERTSGADVGHAMAATAMHVGPGILTAATTTALAFFAAMLADFQAVAELGWIAGSGVLLCAVSCLTVMPALLRLVDRREEPAPVAIPITIRSAWLPALAGKPRLVIALCLGLMGLLTTYAWQVGYDHNLLHLQAAGLDSVKWELTLIKHTAGSSWHALSYTATPEEALALKARYEKLPAVSRVVEVASLLPADQESKRVLLEDIQHRLRRLPQRGTIIPHARPSARDIRNELTCLVGQLQGLADVSAQPILADLHLSLNRWRDQLPDPVLAGVTEERLREFEQRLAGDLAEDLHRLREVSVPESITIADLPVPLRDRFIGKNGKWLLRVFARECLWEYGPLEEFVRQTALIDPETTGKPLSTLEGLRAMRNGFLWAGFYAFGAIVVVLLADFRHVGHTLLALAPLVMGMALSLGFMAMCGMPLNPANMLALPLILGVGVDNGVHVLHDYLSRRGTGRYTLSHTIGRGILVAALTTMLGFGTLMISSHRGLTSLGFILTLGVGCCMFAALIFLPAVLRLLSMREHASHAASLVQERAA